MGGVQLPPEVTVDPETPRAAPQASYTLYWRRWVVLTVFGLVSFFSANIWIGFASVQDTAREFYGGVSDFAINALSMVYMLVFLVGVPFSSWVIDAVSLRSGVVAGALINVAGAWLRYYASLESVRSYPLLLSGQTVCAVAQCFILGTPPKLSAAWFGVRERNASTSIGVLFNQAGTAFGFLLPQLVNKDMLLLTIVQAVASSAALVGVLLWFHSRPATPPTPSAQRKEEMPFRKAVRELARHPAFGLLVLAFGVGIGTIYAISTVLQQLMSPSGYSEGNAGLVGFVGTFVGLLGPILSSLAIEQTIFTSKHVANVVYIGSALSLIVFGLVLPHHNLAVLITVYVIAATLLTAMQSVSFELAVDLTYPLPEATSSNLLLASAQVFGMGFIVAFGLVDDVTGRWMLCLTTLVSVAMVLLVSGELKRSAADNTDTPAPGGEEGTQGLLAGAG